MLNVRHEIDRLRTLKVSQLQCEFEDLTGEPARSNNRTFLIKRITWRLQARAEGGLSERAIELASQLAREQDLRVRPRPEIHAAFADSVELSAADASSGTTPTSGQWLVRSYRGRRIEVKVLESGFEWQGVTYPSLTAVAKAVTGSDWNGRLFFGLTGRKGTKKC